jgi:hypothetical protein
MGKEEGVLHLSHDFQIKHAGWEKCAEMFNFCTKIAVSPMKGLKN